MNKIHLIILAAAAMLPLSIRAQYAWQDGAEAGKLDLGKDVPPEEVVEAVEKSGAPLVGLSALMTTTVASMEETIKKLREKAPHVKVMVGGAVLTQEYADMIGADFYAKDAMQSVRFAEELFA